jgi:hypothetical protein
LFRCTQQPGNRKGIAEIGVFNSFVASLSFRFDPQQDDCLVWQISPDTSGCVDKVGFLHLVCLGSFASIRRANPVWSLLQRDDFPTLNSLLGSSDG